MSDASESHLIERLVETTQVYRGHFLDIRNDRVSLPNGLLASREYVLHPGAVMIVPMFDDGRLLLERQYRHPLGKVILEFPAGKLDPGESRHGAAVRELEEETGFSAREWACAGVMHNAAAYSTEFIEIWFARGLTAGERHLDEGELIDLCLLDEAALDRLASTGELTDAKTLIGLMWLQKWRLGLWSLAWKTAEEASSA